ncbi:hypothetical protein DOI34_25935 [Salmonella enterica subsp. enterica serovar Virchow]|nr:hypothetical protein [Salmonella enterica subsp. enterica serovar Virchow]
MLEIEFWARQCPFALDPGRLEQLARLDVAMLGGVVKFAGQSASSTIENDLSRQCQIMVDRYGPGGKWIAGLLREQ